LEGNFYRWRGTFKASAHRVRVELTQGLCKGKYNKKVIIIYIYIYIYIILYIYGRGLWGGGCGVGCGLWAVGAMWCRVLSCVCRVAPCVVVYAVWCHVLGTLCFRV
jgi:hypothetical protein